MNDRFTVQELIEALTQRHDMELADAEAFVHTFFKLIEERLESDRYVKIKGLGTFKLVNIDSRESIDVNTGKRIEIKSHNRIVFTPDSIMRNLVNKPFAHFETVQLNENTYFDDFDKNENQMNSDENPKESSPVEEEYIAVNKNDVHIEPMNEILPFDEEKHKKMWPYIVISIFIGACIGGLGVWLFMGL